MAVMWKTDEPIFCNSRATQSNVFKLQDRWFQFHIRKNVITRIGWWWIPLHWRCSNRGWMTPCQKCSRQGFLDRRLDLMTLAVPSRSWILWFFKFGCSYAWEDGWTNCLISLPQLPTTLFKAQSFRNVSILQTSKWWQKFSMTPSFPL